jgi:hypothetical protein
MAEDTAALKFAQAKDLIKELTDRIDLETVHRSILFLMETYVATESWAIQRIVDRNLDNASENGYFKPGRQLAEATAEQISRDLVVFASDMESFDPETLVPFIESWMARR